MVCLSRNFGHQTAITTGLEHSSGDAVIIMDGDLQDPPEVIPQFIDKWREGYEVVYAIKKKRKENIFKRSAYFIFYRILKYLTPFEIPLDSGDFSIIDRKIVTILNTLPEKNRFIRGLRSWTGFKQIGLEYERDARTAEKPKYTFIKLINLAIDGLISFSDVPLKIISSIGFFFTLLSLLGIGLIFYIKIYVNPNIIQGWANIMVTIIFMGGVQFIFLGIIGEYLARIFDEVKQRPHYIIKKTLNLTPKKIDNQ